MKKTKENSLREKRMSKEHDRNRSVLVVWENVRNRWVREVWHRRWKPAQTHMHAHKHTHTHAHAHTYTQTHTQEGQTAAAITGTLKATRAVQ